MDASVDAGVDAGSDTGMDAGSDTGMDAGSDSGMDASVDAGILLRYFSTYDSASGFSKSQDFQLKYVTGWSAGQRWLGGGMTLQQGQPWGVNNTK